MSRVKYIDVFHNELRRHTSLGMRTGLVQSMGRVGSALDNASAKSFNSTLRTEFVCRRAFSSRVQARQQIGAWIDQFYNHRRRHSWCGGISPVAQARQPSQDQQRSAA